MKYNVITEPGNDHGYISINGDFISNAAHPLSCMAVLVVILFCTMLPTCTLKESIKSSDNDNVRYNELSDYLNQLTSEDMFSGVVLISKGNGIVFEKAFGMADKNQNQLNNADTKFNIGSAGKMFTSVAVMQLVEQRKLSLNDTIGKYMNGFPNEAANKITVAHLLTHTAGLGDIFTPSYFEHQDEIDTVEGLLPYITRQPLRFEPGTQHEYSNGGFIVLGAIIEKVSGENYYDYIRRHITRPLGMTNTDFYKKFDNVPNLARGYTSMRGGMQPGPPPPSNNRNPPIREDNLSTLPLIGSPAGGAYSTVGDMLKFSSALTKYTLLSKEYTDLSMSGKVATPMGKYGYGFEDLVENGHRTVGHSGGAPGVNALFRILVDDNCTIIIFSNYDDGTRRPYEEIINRYIP